jgi:hypothetical protein
MVMSSQASGLPVHYRGSPGPAAVRRPVWEISDIPTEERLRYPVPVTAYGRFLGGIE